MIDFTKPVKTRDGRPVEIISTKGRGSQPIVGYIYKDEHPSVWSSSGTFYDDGMQSGYDLINVPEPVELWVNVCSGNSATGYSDRHAADWCNSAAAIMRLALLHITRDATGWHIEEVK